MFSTNTVFEHFNLQLFESIGAKSQTQGANLLE